MYVRISGFDNARYERHGLQPVVVREFDGPVTYVLGAIADWKESNPHIKAIEFNELRLN
ncbi:hypothetical protein J4U00_gp125 [Mycobacterium phage DyoEdafos]|uniref:Uncharacterized protein n=1 Tax=Mycobacterium phage DyoEdafos TaxID=2599860 RepID=A0A5J6TID2_9CAUD|nr:hypothetical protein J4U00_gp125 [Mycobacterium phage DyoEdafos]QFG10356.1 hypothetical protein SEA_DYOEDAFOS_144 [Mycobacterium phage DyoEdafos]